MQILLSLIGLSSGMVISGGVFTTLIAIGLMPRFAGKTHTAKHILLYEDMIVFGTIFGGILTVYKYYFHFSTTFFPTLFMSFYGLFAGVFVGCLAIAIAEMLNSIPIFSRRISFSKTGLVILFMALGKLVGSLLYFTVFEF